VGTNGTLECKFLPKTGTVRCDRLPAFLQRPDVTVLSIVQIVLPPLHTSIRVQRFARENSHLLSIFAGEKSCIDPTLDNAFSPFSGV
jgi:hypothetical protein